MTPSPRLLCFDFDGTLADTMPLLERNAVQIIQTYFHLDQAAARRAYRLSTGLPFSEQINTTFPQFPRDVREPARV